MNRITLFGTAALTVGGLMFSSGCKRDQTASNTPDNRTAGEKTRDAVATAGQKTGDALGTAVDKTADAGKSAGEKLKATTQPSADTALKDSRDTLASAVQAALTNNGINDLVERFSKADRDRIGKIDKASLADLNKQIGQFKQDWKAKYNADFKLSDKEQLVFGSPVTIQLGADLVDNARLASEKTPPAGTPANDKSVNNTTSVAFPAEGGAPAVNLTLHNEGTVMSSYKIDVPDTLDGNALRSNLTHHLEMVNQMKDQWPADQNEAARIVSHHIFEAIMNVQ